MHNFHFYTNFYFFKGDYTNLWRKKINEPLFAPQTENNHPRQTSRVANMLLHLTELHMNSVTYIGLVRWSKTWLKNTVPAGLLWEKNTVQLNEWTVSCEGNQPAGWFPQTSEHHHCENRRKTKKDWRISTLVDLWLAPNLVEFFYTTRVLRLWVIILSLFESWLISSSRKRGVRDVTFLKKTTTTSTWRCLFHW